MNRKKTEAQRMATRIISVLAELENLSVSDRSKAFEIAAQCLDLRGSVTGVQYADACKALANAQWLQLFDGRFGEVKK